MVDQNGAEWYLVDRRCRALVSAVRTMSRLETGDPGEVGDRAVIGAGVWVASEILSPPAMIPQVLRCNGYYMFTRKWEPRPSDLVSSASDDMRAVAHFGANHWYHRRGTAIS